MTWDERIQKETIRRLSRGLHDLKAPVGDGFSRDIEAEIEDAISRYSHLLVDEKTQPHLRLAACVLACYRAIARQYLDPEPAQEMLEDVFVSIGRTMLKLYSRAILSFSKDPFKAMTSAGKKRALEQYGAAWEFQIEEDEDTFIMTSTKCFYHDFFSAAGAPHLTRIFCAWDENWIQPIDPAKHGILFERPTTMGYGGRDCPFVFKRI